MRDDLIPLDVFLYEDIFLEHHGEVVENIAKSSQALRKISLWK